MMDSWQIAVADALARLEVRIAKLEQAVDALKNNPTHKAMIEEVFGKAEE